MARESDVQAEVSSLALCHVWLSPSFQTVFLFVWIKPVISRTWEGATKKSVHLLQNIQRLHVTGGIPTVPAVLHMNKPILWNSVLHLKEERKRRNKKKKEKKGKRQKREKRKNRKKGRKGKKREKKEEKGLFRNAIASTLKYKTTAQSAINMELLAQVRPRVSFSF